MQRNSVAVPRQSKAGRGKGNAWLRGAMAEQGVEMRRKGVA